MGAYKTVQPRLQGFAVMSAPRMRTLLGGSAIPAYVALVGLPILALEAVLKAGAALRTPGIANLPQRISFAGQPAPMDLFLLILQLAVVLLAARLVGMAFRRIGQPQVVGEMVAGILLGPSLLGRVAPGISTFLFPPGSLGYLGALSQVGLVLFLFVVGLSLELEKLRKHSRAALLVSHASIVIPFFLGSVLALFLFPHLAEPGVRFKSFALFMGSAMSITAFPVLARILAERNLLSSRLGTLAISCAAIDDVTGWCILAYVVALVRSDSTSSPLWVSMGGALVYVLVMILVVKPLLARWESSFLKQGRVSEGSVSVVIVLTLFSALTTEKLGIHSLFGAFFMGAIMPGRSELCQQLINKLEPFTTVALLPLFFAFSGLRTGVGLVQGKLWLYTLLVVGVAIAGKFGASTCAARMGGIPWRDAASLGILMNTRGLMELITLNIGLEIGVISPVVFTIMVLMALTTTLMTSPLLTWAYLRPSVPVSVAARTS